MTADPRTRSVPPEAVRLEGTACPCCGISVYQYDEVLGCVSCGWSSDPEFDCREQWERGEEKEDGNMLVCPLGCWYRVYSESRY